MKPLLLLCAFFLRMIVSAQFIPQPVAYNPDENADGLIGFSDLAGLLALYGNTFFNGDSTQIQSFETPDTCPAFFGENACLVSEDTDILYWTTSLAQCSYEPVIRLPNGNSWKTLLIFLSSDNAQEQLIRIRIEEDSVVATDDNGTNYYENLFDDVWMVPGRDKFKLLIRGHNGIWYEQTGSQNGNY